MDAESGLTEYFAYGSNMSEAVIRRWCPGHRLVGAAALDNHRLAFTRRSEITGTGVADAVPEPGQTMWGVLYEIRDEDLVELDHKEAAGRGYQRQPCRVQILADQSRHDAVMYTVLRKEPREVPPSREYLERMIAGARDRGLPEDYIAALSTRWSR